MTKEELFGRLKEHYKEIIEKMDITDQTVHVKCRGLSPEEAIGKTDRVDMPIMNGKEIMIQAEVDGYIGQAFTSTACSYQGTLQDILNMEIVEDGYNRAVFIATLNALMRKNGECDRTIHCKDRGPNDCAKKTREWIREHFGCPKITLIGYQPFLLEEMAKEFPTRVLDLNPDNIGDERYGVIVEDGFEARDDAIAWADIVFCTSSTLGNATIVDYMNLDKSTYFYGTTGCCAAAIFGLERSCYADQKEQKYN